MEFDQEYEDQSLIHGFDMYIKNKETPKENTLLFEGAVEDTTRYFENDIDLLELDHKKEGKLKGMLSRITLKHGGGIKIKNKWYSISRFKQILNIHPILPQRIFNINPLNEEKTELYLEVYK